MRGKKNKNKKNHLDIKEPKTSEHAKTKLASIYIDIYIF